MRSFDSYQDRHDDLRATLRARLGDDLVSCDERDLAAHAEDGFGAHRPRPSWLAAHAPQPAAVVRPRATADVAALLRLANECGFAVVPYGGGTGLMGGAVPSSNERRPVVSLAMPAMRRIREVRPADRLVWAEAGATLAQVDEALRPHGLMVGHDPWTFNLATVGGAIGTDGLGYLGGRYGGMGDQTLAVEAVLPTGAVIVTRPAGKHSTGLDLRGLFAGTEGTMGVVTAAALRAFPIPEERLLRGYAFPGFERGLEVVAAMTGIGLAPALLDYGQSFPPPPIAALRRFFAGPARSEGARLMLGFEGFREGARAEAERADRICREQGGAPLGDDDARSFWEGRHATADRFADRRAGRVVDGLFRLARNVRFDFVHVALPASRVGPYWRAARELCGREGVHVVEAGLWARPGLFSLALVKASRSARATEEGLAATVDALLRLALEHGGSMEYCHGVGVRLAHLMAEEHGQDGLEAMRAIKRALDPAGVLNPGKLGL